MMCVARLQGWIRKKILKWVPITWDLVFQKGTQELFQGAACLAPHIVHTMVHDRKIKTSVSQCGVSCHRETGTAVGLIACQTLDLKKAHWALFPKTIRYI